MTDEITVSFPLDGGFLRRRCSACGRQFKWGTESPGPDDGGEESQYHCPYCNHQADASVAAWMTEAQSTYAKEYALHSSLGPALRELDASLKRLSKSGGMAGSSVHGTGIVPREPTPLSEPTDMVRVDFSCHPEQPLKVADDWVGPVHCLICGALRSE